MRSRKGSGEAEFRGSVKCHRNYTVIKALGVPTQSMERSRSGSLSRNAAQATAPLHGAAPTDGARAQLCASAHPARREARAPAGPPKNTAPSKSAAEKSAALHPPSHFPTLLIDTGTDKTTGLVSAADRAGCPKCSQMERSHKRLRYSTPANQLRIFGLRWTISPVGAIAAHCPRRVNEVEKQPT